MKNIAVYANQDSMDPMVLPCVLRDLVGPSTRVTLVDKAVGFRELVEDLGATPDVIVPDPADGKDMYKRADEALIATGPELVIYVGAMVRGENRMTGLRPFHNYAAPRLGHAGVRVIELIANGSSTYEAVA